MSFSVNIFRASQLKWNVAQLKLKQLSFFNQYFITPLINYYFSPIRTGSQLKAQLQILQLFINMDRNLEDNQDDVVLFNDNENDPAHQPAPNYQPLPQQDNRTNRIYPENDFPPQSQPHNDYATPRPEEALLLFKDSDSDMKVNNHELVGAEKELQIWLQDFNNQQGPNREPTNKEKQEALVSNIYSGMILCRRITRLLLSFILLGFFVGFFTWGYFVSLQAGTWDSKKSYDTIKVKSRNCFINITDSEDNVKFDYIAKGSLLKHVNASDTYVVSGVENSDGSLALNFINPLPDMTNCFIDLKLPKQVKSFEFLCLNTSQCVITSHMESFTASSLLNISAEVESYMEINYRDVKTEEFFLYSTSAGILILNHIIATKANIDLLAGDIVIQSSQDYEVDFTSSGHSFCMSAPNLIQQSLTNCYINEATKANKDNNLVCTGKVQICATGTCATTQLYEIESHAATIYANRLKSPGKPYIHQRESVTILKSGQFYKPVEFDDETKRQITNFLNKTLSDADIAIRIDIGGSLNLQSASNSYWAYFSNPSYANFDPWWLSVFSATFLNPQFKKIVASLDPGFCPWYPVEPTLGQLYDLQQYMNSYFNKTYGKAIYLSKDNRPLPEDTLSSEQSYPGTEQLTNKERNRYEEWFTIQKTADILTFQLLPYDQFFIAAIVVSVVSSALFGVMAVFSLVLILQTIEAYILQTTSQFQFYSATSQKGSQERLNQAAKLMIDKLDQLASKKEPPVLQGVFTYLWYIIAQSITKDSAKMFCETFFKRSDPDQTADYYNQNLDEKYLRIDEWRLKEMYEQFCFINQMKIDQISQQDQLLEYYGFEIGEKGEAVLLSKVKLKPNRKPYNQLSEKEKSSGDSLELFMATQVLITGIPADMIESAFLESEYQKFCGKVLQKVPFNPKDIANDYGLAISDQKVYEVRKIRTGNQEKQNILVRILGRCTHYLPLIEDYHDQPPVYILNVDSESNKFLTNPLKTLSTHHKICHDIWSYNFFRMIIESIRYNYKQRIFDRPYFYGNKDNKDDYNVLRDYFDILYMRGWMTTDFVIVTGNMIITAISILPIAFFLMIVNTSYTPFSIYNPKSLMFANDILQRPWSVFQYQYQVDEWVIAGAILILYYGAITFVFQSIKYLLSYFPDEIGFLLEFKLYQYRVMKWFNAFQYYQFLLLMFLVFTYFGLVIVWLILGAIINPNNYLVYSSCALTLVATISAEYSSIKELYQQACDEVKKMIMDLYLRTFGQLATNLIKEVQRLSDNTVNLINSTGMDQAKDMAEQLGFGEELNELCVLTQNMLDNNTASTLDMDQLNFKSIKDKFMEKACEKFIKIARDQFGVPELIAEQLVKSNFLKFEEIVDTLANQVQITSSNKIPASLVKWLYQTIVRLNRVMSKKTSEEQRKEMSQTLPKITFSLFDAVINGMMLKVTIDDKGASQEALKSVVNCMYSITQDKSPLNMLKQIRLLFTNLKDQVAVTTLPLQVLEFAFNYAEALNDPATNIESVQSDMIKQLLNIFNIDPDISIIFQFLFLGQRQFIEKGQVMTATEIAGQLIRLQENHFKLEHHDIKKKTFDLLALAGVKYLKNDRLPVQEMINLVAPENYQDQLQQLLESNNNWVNAALSIFTLAAKDWRPMLQLDDKGTNTEYLKDVLLLGTKSLWNTHFIDKKKELSGSEEQKDGATWDQKYFKQGAAKISDRVQHLVKSELVEQISHMFGIDQPSTIGLILFLKGEGLDSDYFDSFCQTILKFADKDMKSSSSVVKELLQVYSCRTFEDFNTLFFQRRESSNLAKAYINLVMSSPTTFKIFNGSRLVEDLQNPTKRPIKERERYERLLDYFSDKEKEQQLQNLLARLAEKQSQPDRLGSDDYEIVNHYKSEKANFLTYLRRNLKGEEASRKAKSDMADAIRNMFQIKHDYLFMLLEIQQNLSQGQNLNLNLLPGLKVEPFRALLQIMSFKDAAQVCAGLKYFLDGNPSILVNLSTIQNGMQVFVEVEQLLATMVVPPQLPYYLYKLLPVVINNLLGTRAPIPNSFYFDCMNLLFDLEPIGIDDHNKQTLVTFMTILFEKNSEKRKKALKQLLLQLCYYGQIKITSSQDEKVGQVADYIIALAEKDYGKLLNSLADYFKNIDPPEFRAFYQKVAQIIRGFSSVSNNQSSNNDSNDTKNLVWATQQLKYFITYDKDAFQDLILAYFAKFVGTEKANMDAINALFSLFTDKPDVKSLVSLFQIEEEFIQLTRFLVYAIMSDKKSALLQDQNVQEVIEKRMKISDIEIIIELSDFIEQNIKEIPKLMSRLGLDSNPINQKVFSAFIYYRMQPKSTGTWGGNIKRYADFAQQRSEIFKSEATELILWFASPRPITFLYQQNNFVSGDVSYMFAAIAAFAKYDYHDRYAKRQPEYIKHKMNKVAALSAKSDEKALLFIAESSEQDLTEGYLMLQMATGINPILTGAIMGNVSCQNDILQSFTVQIQELIMGSIVRFDDYDSLDIYERLYIVEYEFAKMAAAFEFEGKPELLKKVDAAQKNVAKLLFRNGRLDSLDILTKFLSDSSQGELQKNFPLSSVVLIYALKHLRQEKKSKALQVQQYMKAVHYIDMILTVFERYSYFFEPKQLQTINKPVLTRLLSFGLFDSQVLRASGVKQSLVEGLLYPAISDNFMPQKYGINQNLIDGVKQSSNQGELAKHYLSILPDYQKVFVAIQEGDIKKEGKLADYSLLWKQLIQGVEPQGPLINLQAKPELQDNKVGENYEQLAGKLPADPKNPNLAIQLKAQAQKITQLQSVNLQQVAFLRTKYMDKAIALLKKMLLKPSEIEMMNSDQITEQKEHIIVNLLSYYACQYSLEDNQHQQQQQVANPKAQPQIGLGNNSQNAFKLFVTNPAPRPAKFNKQKNKQLISRTQLIDAILSVNMNEQEKDACKFLVQLLYDPRKLKKEDFKFLWDNQENKMTGLILMMIRMQLEYSKQEGKFTQLANNVPSCYLYYSIGDQFESTQDLQQYKDNNKSLNSGMEELIIDCTEIDAKLRVPLKLLIRCYLGDVEAWYALIAFSRKQSDLETSYLSEKMIHVFIVELLSYLKNLGLRNPKLTKGQVASQSFLQILSSSPEFNLKSSLEAVLMKTFKLTVIEKDVRFAQKKPGDDDKQIKLQKANNVSKNFVKYLDFIIDGNIAVLKDDLLPIMQGIFEVKQESDWNKISKPMQLIMQMLFKGNCPNENFLAFEEQVKPSFEKSQTAWKLIKLVIEAQHCNDFKVCVKKLLDFTLEYDIPQIKPYLSAMIGVNAALNIKNLASNKEMAGNQVELIDLIMTPVCWVVSLINPDQFAGDLELLRSSIEFSKKFVQTKQGSNAQFLSLTLQQIDSIETTEKQKDSQFFTDANIKFFSEGLQQWCQANQESQFKIIFDEMKALINYDKLPPKVKVIGEVIITLLLKKDLEPLIKKFIDELSKSPVLVEYAPVIEAATVGLSKIRSAEQVKANDFSDTVIKLLSRSKGFDELASALLATYQKNDQDKLQQLPKIIQKLCFSGSAYDGKFQSIPLDQIFSIALAGLEFIRGIENSKDVDELKIIENVKPVFEPMFKGEEKKDFQVLIKCLEAFIAIKNKRFNEINSEFFQVMKISQSNSQLLVKLMQDFQTGLKTPQKMIQEKMGQFINPTVVRQMQYMNSVTQKLNENRELQYEDMYRIIDKNGERRVSALSVLEFLRRIQIQITQHKFVEILVKIKQEQVNNIEACMIDVYEFKEIMAEISVQTMELSLQFLNISKGLLAKALIMLAIYLVLVIVFILIGVQAFAIPGTFASIVNSILPMIGGLSLNRASAEEKLKALNIERMRDIVKKAVRLIQTARI